MLGTTTLTDVIRRKTLLSLLLILILLSRQCRADNTKYSKSNRLKSLEPDRILTGVRGSGDTYFCYHTKCWGTGPNAHVSLECYHEFHACLVDEAGYPNCARLGRGQRREELVCRKSGGLRECDGCVHNSYGAPSCVCEFDHWFWMIMTVIAACVTTVCLVMFGRVLYTQMWELRRTQYTVIPETMIIAIHKKRVARNLLPSSRVRSTRY